MGEGDRERATLHEELGAIVETMETPRDPKQRRSREKRTRILLTAARLFAKRGVDGTTTKEIARESDVSIGTVYSYFTDKSQILLSLVADNASVVLGPAGARFDLRTDPRGALRHALEETIPYDPERAYLRQCWAELVVNNRKIAEVGDMIHERLYDALLEAARDARGRADFRTEIDLESTVWAVLSLFDRLWHQPNRPGAAGKREFLRRRDAVAELAYHAFFSGSEQKE